MEEFEGRMLDEDSIFFWGLFGQWVGGIFRQGILLRDFYKREKSGLENQSKNRSLIAPNGGYALKVGV